MNNIIEPVKIKSGGKILELDLRKTEDLENWNPSLNFQANSSYKVDWIQFLSSITNQWQNPSFQKIDRYTVSE